MIGRFAEVGESSKHERYDQHQKYVDKSMIIVHYLILVSVLSPDVIE